MNSDSKLTSWTPQWTGSRSMNQRHGDVVAVRAVIAVSHQSGFGQNRALAATH